jgi:saccharopine dehydrogenase (NAD+, L-lysine-forming)
MIYGANGYTGDLVARLAASRGQRPVLAGRSATAVAALADELGLERAVVDLGDAAGLRSALHDVTAVAHCAGPFARTSAPMIDACLATGTAYLDVTGELRVFEAVLARSAEAVEAGVALVTGAGFDVVPTDCLAGMLCAALPEAVSLEIAFRAPGGMSRGTATTGLAMAADGGRRRIDGELVTTPLGVPAREVPFPSRPRRVGAVPWGDLVTAHHSTGVDTITVYTTLAPRGPVRRAVAGLGQRLLRYDGPRAFAARAIRRRPPGPSAATRRATVIEVWGRAAAADGSAVTATLTGPNAYDLTADAVLHGVGRVLAGGVPPGAHTPATAFGADFVRELDGVVVSDITPA